VVSSAPVGLRVLRPDGDRARVAVVHTSAMLVAGDDLRLEVRVGPGASCELCEISASVAHPADGQGLIEQQLAVQVGEAGTLLLCERELVLAAASRLRRTTRIELTGSARVAHRETIVLGRYGEAPGAAVVRTRVERDGLPVFDDTLDTRDAATIRSPAVLGASRVVGTFGLWGVSAPPRAPGVFGLGPQDSLMRVLARDASVAVAELDAFERLVRGNLSDGRDVPALDAGQSSARPDGRSAARVAHSTAALTSDHAGREDQRRDADPLAAQ
jgi:urease accessory protein